MSSSSISDNRPNENMNALKRILVLGFFVALVTVPVVHYALTTDAPNWWAAYALEMYDDGQTERAIAMMAEAREKSNDGFHLSIELAGMLAESGQADDGVAICDELLREPGLTEERRHNAIMARANCLQHAGRFGEALQLYLENVANEPNYKLLPTSVLKNEAAYFRALSGKQLAIAESDIKKAIQNVEKTTLFGSGGMKPDLPTRCLLGSAIVARQTGKQATLLTPITSYIERLRELEFDRRMQVTESVDDAFKKGVPSDKSQLSKATNQARSKYQQVHESLGLLLAARSLLHSDLDDSGAEERDKRAVETLGYGWDDLISKLPTGIDCLNLVGQGTSYLDTRGFVRSRRKKHVLAAVDLDLAVVAAEASLDLLSSPISNSVYFMNGDPDVRDLEKQLRRTCAVVRYHRIQNSEAWIKTSASEDQEKERIRAQIAADRKRIRELGHTASPTLF